MCDHWKPPSQRCEVALQIRQFNIVLSLFCLHGVPVKKKAPVTHRLHVVLGWTFHNPFSRREENHGICVVQSHVDKTSGASPVWVHVLRPPSESPFVRSSIDGMWK